MIARAIPGWPGYAVTDEGRVFSLDREVKGRFMSGREMTSFDRMAVKRVGKKRVAVPTGYRSVSLSARGRKVSCYVHALVMLAFVGPYPSPDHEILHGDGNRANNALRNLRYGTVKENAADRETHGTAVRGERHGRAKHSIDTIRAIKQRITNGETVSAIARACGVHTATVSQIRSGKQWSHVAA